MRDDDERRLLEQHILSHQRLDQLYFTKAISQP